MNRQVSVQKKESDINVGIIDRSISANIVVVTAFVNTDDRSIIARIADIG